MGPALTHSCHRQAHTEQLLCARCCGTWPVYEAGEHLVCWLTNPFLTLDTENGRGRRRNLALAGRKLSGHPEVDPWGGYPMREPPARCPALVFLNWLCFGVS